MFCLGHGRLICALNCPLHCCTGWWVNFMCKILLRRSQGSVWYPTCPCSGHSWDSGWSRCCCSWPWRHGCGQWSNLAWKMQLRRSQGSVWYPHMPVFRTVQGPRMVQMLLILTLVPWWWAVVWPGMKNAAQEVTKISLIHPHACVQGTPGTKDGSDAAVLDSCIFHIWILAPKSTSSFSPFSIQF